MRRPLTEIELRLGVADHEPVPANNCGTPGRTCWTSTLSVERVESNPQLVQIVPPNEVVVLISFELTIGDLRGMMNLCIPFNSIERIGGKLSSNSWISYGRRNSTPDTRKNIAGNLKGAKVHVVAQLAATRINTGDLLGLRVGDIITTDKDVHEPLEIQVEGILKFRAKAGAFKGHKAIQIDQALGLMPPPTVSIK